MHLLSILLLSLAALLDSGQTATLLFAGDAMQHAPQFQNARQSDGTYDYSGCFTLLEPEIQAADYAVVNLEVTLGGKPYSGYPCFSAPDSYARQLQTSGFDLLLTANNHCLDRRDRGLVRTINTLDQMGIPHIGTWVNVQARSKGLPFIANIKGYEVAFLDYTYGTNGIKIKGDVVVDYIDKQKIKDDIAQARRKGAQLVCVNMHWGIEYKLLPVQSQRDLADFLEDQGVDLIIGGHPHVVEPMEWRHSAKWNKDVLVVYSMGNFISNMSAIDCRGGAMVMVNIESHEGKPVIASPRYRLFFCQKPGGGARTYSLIPENKAQRVASGQQSTARNYFERTRRLVMSHNVGVPSAP